MNNEIKDKGIMSAAQTMWIMDFDSEKSMETGIVLNQKFTGKCWIYAGLNYLKTVVDIKSDSKGLQLSANYISYYDKIEKSKLFFQNVMETVELPSDDRMLEFLFKNPCSDAGQWVMFKNIIKKYGVVPQEAMPDTYSALNSNQMNICLTTILRDGGCNIRRMCIEGANVELINSEVNKKMNEITRVLSLCLGEPPIEFLYGQNEKYTPLLFYKRIIDVNLDKYICLINSPMSMMPFYKKYYVKNLNNMSDGERIEYINLPIENLEKKVIQQVQNGYPVWFGCDAGKMIDKTTGMMDDNTFNISDVLNISYSFLKGEQLEYYQSVMNHAMLIVGIISKQQEIVGFKVEDSHGNQVGRNGYFYMSLDWFEKYVYQVVIDEQYLSINERKLLDEEGICIMPWNPIGTLAE